MRKLFLLYIFLFILFPAIAQNRLSVVAGIHKSSVSPFLQLQPGASSQVMQQKSSVHFGFMADLSIQRYSNWYFQPGIIYTTRGAKQQQSFDTSQTKLTYYQYTQSINYIDLPMNLVYKFPSATNTRFILGGGPSVSLFYSGSISNSSLDTLGNLSMDTNRDLSVGNSNQQFRLFHWGLNFLAGLEFGKAYLTANFNKAFTPYYFQGSTQYKFTSFGLTLGIFLGSPTEEDRNVRDGVYECPIWW